MGRWWLCAVLLVGCGRLQFDPVGSRDGGASDDVLALIDAPDGAVAGACPANALLCDDFETGVLMPPWSYYDLNGPTMLAPSTVRPHSGIYSLDAAMGMNNVEGMAGTVYRFNSTSTGTLAVREWINQPVPMINFDLVMILRQQQRYLSVGADGLGNWIVTEQVPSVGLYDHKTTIAAPGVNAWVCVELVVHLSSPRSFQVYSNGALILDEAFNETTPAYTEVSIGVSRADMAGYEVFVDDVVLAPQRIGC
ncbi:MAG TPA: hypothetical protein VL326_02055 [Kofleriaceae bacterium]|jgi:hypothetical protein|nr:hypothetical protein [Kofleriaceae bacterium]